MIPLGSCTMKLNAAAELTPISWPRFAAMHPFAQNERRGYAGMLRELEQMLAEITGFAAVSLQPNSGAGRIRGPARRRNYLRRAERARACLIPASARGTNPASAQMIGLRIVVVACDEHGNVDLADLERKIAEHRGRIAALITYPSTHGVFEEAIVRICAQVHAAGGQVYMDGANMNALAGLAKPALIGDVVCHINLHKTFCIPHGGGGPGMGPIAVTSHLNNSYQATLSTGSKCLWHPVRALILPISWMYIRMMGARGIRKATDHLNANYIARGSRYFAVLYTGAHGRVAHECILDLRKLKDTCASPPRTWRSV